MPERARPVEGVPARTSRSGNSKRIPNKYYVLFVYYYFVTR